MTLLLGSVYLFRPIRLELTLCSVLPQNFLTPRLEAYFERRLFAPESFRAFQEVIENVGLGAVRQRCSNNHLTELDLSPVPNLAQLWCVDTLEILNPPQGLKVGGQ